MNCWAMRTSRDSEKRRKFLRAELLGGRLRQGWGWLECQDLRHLQELWSNGDPLSDEQKQVGRHRRMGNGQGEDYMQVGDLVAVPNMPDDGLFTLCRIEGDYYFEIAKEHGDFGHVRPVEVLTPDGVSNNHHLVHADLRRTFRFRGRLWNIKHHYDSLDSILRSPPSELTRGSTPLERVEGIVPELIADHLNSMEAVLDGALPERVRNQDWEPVLKLALESLFPVSVHHTGGRHERGADIEIVIPNPFDENRDWIVPVQVKDYEGEVGAEAADQLEKAFESRGRINQVIAVVLLVSNAVASKDLVDRMDKLSRQHGVPFVFCGRDLFLRILARGFLRRS